MGKLSADGQLPRSVQRSCRHGLAGRAGNQRVAKQHQRDY